MKKSCTGVRLWVTRKKNRKKKSLTGLGKRGNPLPPSGGGQRVKGFGFKGAKGKRGGTGQDRGVHRVRIESPDKEIRGKCL